MSNVITAAKLELHLMGGSTNQNSQIGLVQRYDYEDNFNFLPLKALGYYYTLGYEPGIFDGSGSVSKIRLFGESLRQVAITEHRNLTVQLNARGLELVSRSKSGQIVDHLTGVVINTVRTGSDVGSQLSMEDATFFYVRVIEQR